MKNIHVLPTDKPSNLLLCIKDYTEHKDTPAENSDIKGKFRIGFGSYANTDFYKFQNIYITNDEEIKNGDFVYNVNLNIVVKAKNSGKQGEGGWYKIILTTDDQLIQDGIQAIPDEFIEWFVKNPSCEWVEFEKEIFKLVSNPNYKKFTPDNDGIYLTPIEETLQKGETIIEDNIIEYKIIIPKEEPKQRKDCHCIYPEFDVMKGICKVCGNSIIHLGRKISTADNDSTKQEITFEEIEKQVILTEARGEEIVKYLDMYKGQSIYNEIALAIEFGYQLKLKEDA